MKRYKSKIGRSIVLFLIIVLGSVSAIMIYNQEWVGLSIILASVAFIYAIFSSTYYDVDDSNLVISSSFMYKRTIPINSIIKISETKNPLSAPALSLDRLEIKPQKGEAVMISPKDKIEFINHLRRINPKIDIG